MENIIHLDTHVVVWLYGGNLDLIPDNTKKLMKNNDLYISPIVQLELQYLFEIKRISKTGSEIYKFLNEDIGLKISNSEFSKVVEISLQNNWTRDPFDRIITAQAQLEKVQLITKDETIHKNFRDAVW